MGMGCLGRRGLLRGAVASVAGTLLMGCRKTQAVPERRLRIEDPIHGAIMNRRQGRLTDGGLKIEVRGQAAGLEGVAVNGVPARREGDRFIAEVVLREPQTDVVATAKSPSGMLEHRVRVVWDRHSFARYRFSIDDNSFFLRDIAQKKYASLFDCFYLTMLRDLHTRYGTKFVLNIYYKTEDGFELPQFPDRYKGQWRDNADWLKLAFHAWTNDPPRPYQNATPERLISDLDKVAEQIIRFAGESTYSPPTVIHYAMAPHSAFKPLYSRGVRVLSGFFTRNKGVYDINYLMDDVRSEYLSRHDALMDFESGIAFSRIDIVCNNTPVDRVVPTLAPLAADPNTAEIMDFFTHEQYFWPFYTNYIRDHPQRVEATIRWATEQGYKPVFYHEGLLGAPL